MNKLGMFEAQLVIQSKQEMRSEKTWSEGDGYA